MRFFKTGPGPASAASAALAALAAAGCFSAAQAATIDVNLAGWNAVNGFSLAGNTEAFVALPLGSTVTGFDYVGLNFTTTGDSWQSELVLSVNNAQVSTAWLDWSPSTTGSSGSFAGSGSWAGATGTDGPFGRGAAFVTSSPTVYVTAYLGYAVPPVGIGISQGTLRIHYDVAPIPEPTTGLLLALGLLAVGAAARSRR